MSERGHVLLDADDRVNTTRLSNEAKKHMKNEGQLDVLWTV